MEICEKCEVDGAADRDRMEINITRNEKNGGFLRLCLWFSKEKWKLRPGQ